MNFIIKKENIMYNKFMANFFYRVKTSDNQLKEGRMIAENLASAAEKLEKRGFVILEIKEVGVNIKSCVDSNLSSKMVLSIQEKKTFFNSLYSLYKSGCSFFEAFDSIHTSTNNEKVKALCSKILAGIKKGKTIEESTEGCSNALGVVFVKLLVAGEKSGKLENVLSNIVKNLELQEKVRNDLISKTTYPLLMFFFAIFVALFMQTFVMPILKAANNGENFSIVLLLISSLFQILLAFLLIGALIFILIKNKILLSKLLSKLTIFTPIANLVKNYSYSNFFSILSLSYSAGLSVVESLKLSSLVVKLPQAEKPLLKATDRIAQGCEITTALEATALFSDYAVSQISTGEKSGELENSLFMVSEDYRNKLLVSLDVILKIIEPLMILIVGLVVLCVLISGNSALNNFLFSI